jgi:hypothetical protein
LQGAGSIRSTTIKFSAGGKIMTKKNSSGDKIPTVAVAATHFGVTCKTVNDWIKKGIIPQPPTVPYGVNYMNTFPPEYLITADIALQMHRERSKKGI